LDVVFYCVGDADAITKLLATIRGIGPGRQIGLGQIAHFAVERMPQADSETWGLIYNGLPARYLPVAFWPEGEQLGWRRVYAAARPPYWHPALRTMCWAPGAAYTLPSMGLLLLG
jgi:CRISPR type IV-associated protein Csf3